MTAGSKSFSTSCPTTPPTSIPGSSKAALHATIRSATGICGASRARTVPNRTTGCRNSAAAPGLTTPSRDNIIIMRSWPSSPTSTGATRKSAAPSTMRCRFWLDKGVDGFRVDVIWHLIKDDQFRDNPSNPNFRAGRPPHEALVNLYSADRPEVQDVVAEMRGVVDEFEGRVLIGEIYLPLDRLVAYYGRDLSGAHLPFNFGLLSAPWHARDIAKLIDDY